MKLPYFVILAALFLVSRSTNASSTLWSIGSKNGTSADLALGANRPDQQFAQRFAEEPLFIVGHSDPVHDWPAIHPGPYDGWADGGSHTFSVAFGLTAVVGGTYDFVVDLVEAHSQLPPKIVVVVNNHPLPVQSPEPGNSDDTLSNRPEVGKHQSLSFRVPAQFLQANNIISIRTDAGSWIIYDAVRFEAPDNAKLAPATGIVFGLVNSDKSLVGTESAARQVLHVPITWLGAPQPAATLAGTLSIDQNITRQINLKPGPQTIDLDFPAVSQKTAFTAALKVDGKTYVSNPIEVVPMRRWTVYILSHSHHDLGYTDVQPRIIDKQIQNLDLALDEIARTKDNPPGAKSVWNAEVLWSLEDYINRHPEHAPQLYSAIQEKTIYPNAWYANVLTGLCRPEELLRLATFGMRLRDQTGFTADSMMISDVPGMSWGSIQALNEAGIRYVSNGPNAFDRIGYTLQATEDKPFYWLSPSGNNKMLFWSSWGGYALAPTIGALTKTRAQAKLLSRLEQLELAHYPYDMTYIRWDGFEDNAPPDDKLIPFVKQWNATHLSPRFVLADTSTVFHALEDKYGKDIPSYKGEFTPYWEDGSGSSAHETSLNRQAAERLVQAETLHALLKPQDVPSRSFYEAWRDVIMYDEHTWGASDSISNPTAPHVIEQWNYKQAFAVNAERRSRELLNGAVQGRGAALAGKFDVFNTCNWPRTEVVALAKDASSSGDAVVDDTGKPVLSQRLSTGELAFLASDVPPFGSKRYSVAAKDFTSPNPPPIHAAGLELSNSLFTLKVDAKSGGITEWTNKDRPENLVDNRQANLNDYIYALGGGLNGLKYPDAPSVTVKESGPLVASLLVRSNAPGANSLSREVRIYHGLPRIDLIDSLDKIDVLEIEAGHIAFPFNLPGGQVRIDSQFAVTRPEIDQIPGSCKNWFTASRWVDISTDHDGVTLATQDAPMIEVGGITATLVRTQGNPAAYRNKVDPTQTLYSWIFNNHWETNYKASQSGLLTYRYALQAHREFDALSVNRFGIELGQPLQIFPAVGPSPISSRLTVEPNNLLVTAFKCSDDGKSLIVRFFNPSDAAVHARTDWAVPQPTQLWRSDISEKPLQKIDGELTVPAWSLLTIRADFP